MTRTVLFLCPHNAAKSLIAAALFEREAARRGLDLRVDTAGTEPDAGPSPAVVAMLAAEGFDVAAHRPRRLRADELAGAWQVVSMGCPIAAQGVTVTHWDDIPAPSDDLDGARARIEARVLALIEALDDVA